MSLSTIAGALLLLGAPAVPNTPVVTAPIVAVTPPVPRRPLERLFSPMDYPAAAQETGAQGRVDVAMLISPAGRVAGCVIKSSSGSSPLDAATCRILRSRAQFKPARDGDGQATMGVFAFSKTWKAPAGEN